MARYKDAGFIIILHDRPVNLGASSLKILLNKPVYVKYRSESLDAFLNAIVDFRREFKAVGFNFNQVVHKLHTLQEIPEFRLWVLVNEKHKDLLFSKIKAIQDRMNEAYDLWQKSQPTEEQKAGK